MKNKMKNENANDLTESFLKHMNFENSDSSFKQRISRPKPPTLSLNKYQLNRRAKRSERPENYLSMDKRFNEDQLQFLNSVVNAGDEIGPRLFGANWKAILSMAFPKLNFSKDKRGMSALYPTLNLNMKEILRYLRNREASRMNAMTFGKRSIEKMDPRLLNENTEKEPYSKSGQMLSNKDETEPYSKEVIHDVIHYILNHRTRDAWRNNEYLQNLRNRGMQRRYTRINKRRDSKTGQTARKRADHYSKEMIQDVIEYLLVLRNREAARMNLMNFGKRTTERIGIEPLNEDKEKRPYSITRETSNMKGLADPYSNDDLQDVDGYLKNVLNREASRMNLMNFGKRTEVPISDQYHPMEYFWKLQSANRFNPDPKRQSMSIVRLKRNHLNYLIH